MKRRRTMTTYLALLSVALLVAGCATAPVSVAAPCLPPDIDPAYPTWPVVGAWTIPAPGEDGPVPLHLVEHRAPDDRRVQAGWYAGRVVLLDPRPDFVAAPYYRSARDYDGDRLRAAPAAGPCRWRPSDEVPA